MAWNRRRFLAGAGIMALGGLGAAGAYPFFEARWFRIVRTTIAVPNLPPAFRGTRVAFLADIHHGPFIPLDYVQRIVAATNALAPDLVLLGGDYVSKRLSFIEPVMHALARLRAPMGRFAVLGNHDHWESASLSREGLDAAGFTRLDNRGIWLERAEARLRLCGVGDLWTDRQDAGSAIGDATRDDAVIMLSHNPDFAEELTDDRVGLVLSGHTHGGQIVLPGYGAPVVPSKYGQKYLGGLVRGPLCRVFVSRGLGTSGPPVRFSSRPEIVHITLR
jgi:predicted MPP superfamily phosphohydrolase